MVRHAARHPRSHAAAVLPPGAFGADEAVLLLGAGAVPDGGRRALSHHAADARDGRRRCSIRCSGRCSCRSRRWPAARDYLGGLADRPKRRGSGAARRWRSSPSEPCQVDQLQQENARLRAELALRPTLSVHSQAAELLYEAADPYSRKVIIDRGLTNNVAARLAGHRRGRRARPGDARATCSRPR